jgi:hypothetical protein
MAELFWIPTVIGLAVTTAAIDSVGQVVDRLYRKLPERQPLSRELARKLAQRLMWLAFAVVAGFATAVIGLGGLMEYMK